MDTAICLDNTHGYKSINEAYYRILYMITITSH